MMNRLFDRYGLLLEWFATTQLGRDYLSGRGLRLPPTVVRLLPNGYIELLERQPTETLLRLTVSADPHHLMRLLRDGLGLVDGVAPLISDFDEAKDLLLYGLGLRSASFLPRLVRSYHALQLTESPDASHLDGRVYRSSTAETWANKHDNAGEGNQHDQNAPELDASTTSNRWDFLARRPIPADTSALTAEATVLAGSKVRIYVNSVTTTLAGQSIRLVTTNAPATLNSLANSDYNLANWGTTAQATDVTVAGLTTGAYNDLTLNATGRGNINLSGVSRLGLRLASDADNAEPTWSSGVVAKINADLYDGAHPSQYVIEYSLPGTAQLLTFV